ncbi:redoxin domain-containing protein [Plantactinospora sp. B6F1]|uniref:redoxin domain-containing protein n=1 Tax=Plantactinospora sp. B6F1 TaxID=3158971 RepID=UPI00102B33CF
MPFLIAALVITGLLCVLNLILTLGVIKRLREHTELLSTIAQGPPAIEVGQVVGEFETTTVDHEALTRDALTGDTLVAFFSPTCGPCKEKLPKFVEHVRALPGRDRSLAVVVGDRDQAQAFVADLRPVTRVVVEAGDGALSSAFRARAYPTLLRVGRDDAGRLVVTANKVEVDQPATLAVR